MTVFSTDLKNLVLDVMMGFTNTSDYPAYVIDFYTGSAPASGDTSPTGTYIAELRLYNSAFSAATGGVCTWPTPGSTQPAANTGTIGYGMIRNSGADKRAYISVGTSGSVGIQLSTLSASVGVALQANKFTVKMPLLNGTVSLNTLAANFLAGFFCGHQNFTTMNMRHSATINFYSGSPPASADAAATGTLLATLTTNANDSRWAAAAGGVVVLNTGISVTPSATGTAGYFRWVKGSYVLQGTVGVSGADFLISTVNLTNGVPFTLNEANVAL